MALSGCATAPATPDVARVAVVDTIAQNIGNPQATFSMSEKEGVALSLKLSKVRPDLAAPRHVNDARILCSHIKAGATDTDQVLAAMTLFSNHKTEHLDRAKAEAVLGVVAAAPFCEKVEAF